METTRRTWLIVLALLFAFTGHAQLNYRVDNLYSRGAVNSVTAHVTNTLTVAGATALTSSSNSTFLLVAGNVGVGGAVAVAGAATLAGGGTSTTPSDGDNGTSLATTAFVQNTITNYLDYLWVPAGAMTPAPLHSAAMITNTPSGADGASFDAYAFDDTTVETNTFTWVAPENWDVGTMKMKPHWTSTAGAGTVVWGIRIGALRNDDAYGAVLGTQQTSTDTLIANNDHHVGPATAAITAGGTPAAGAMLLFQITRETGSDTKTSDALLKGVIIEYTRKTIKVAGW